MSAVDQKKYSYEVIDPDGKRRKGTTVGRDRDEVVASLRAPGWHVLSVEEAGLGKLVGADALYGAIPGLSRYKAKPAKLAGIARRMHQLLRSGLTVTQVLQTMVESTEGYEATVLADIAERVGSGVALAEAMRVYPDVFPETFVAYIDTAEATGTLTETTGRLSQMLEKRASVERRVKAVAIYPVLVAVVITVIITLLLLFVVPRFAQIYTSLGEDVELPLPTQLLMDGARPGAFALLTFAAALMAFIAWKRSGRMPVELAVKVEMVMWRLPIFGSLMRRLALYRWASVLSGGVAAGLKLADAVGLAGRASGSVRLKALTPGVVDSITAGRPLSSALMEHTDVFPADMRAMVLTGERSGDLGSVVEQVAISIDEEIEVQISAMGAKLEVLLLVSLVTVVGGILIAMYLPVLSIAQVALNSLSDS